VQPRGSHVDRFRLIPELSVALFQHDYHHYITRRPTTSHSPCSLSFLLQIALWKSGSEWFLCARVVRCGFFPSSFLLLFLRLLTKGKGEVPMIHRYKEFDPIMTSYLKELRDFVANRRYVSGTASAFYPIHQMWQHSIIFIQHEPLPQLLGETFTAYELRHNSNHFPSMEN
jgi:hypothetical protein